MNEWWQSLAQREKILVSVMSAMIGVAMIYWFLIEPLFIGANDYRDRVATAENNLNWMKEVAPTLPSENGPANAPGGAESLISIVDRTTQQMNLKTRTNQQAGPNKVRVQFDESSFESMVKWFGLLYDKHGVVVDTININREDKAGAVSGTVTIQKAAAK